MKSSIMKGMIETPWETRNLGIPSFELDHGCLINWKDRDLGAELSIAVEGNFFVQLRIPANSPDETLIAEALGFRTAELAINPWIKLSRSPLFTKYLEDFSRFVPSNYESNQIRLNTICVTDVEKSIRQAIIDGSIEAFSADRFHNDPFCDMDIADTRIGMWLEYDLLTKPDLNCTTVSVANDLIGYIVWRDSKLILGGITPKYIGKGFAKLLYLETMRSVSVNSDEVSTTISANNTEVLNLYSRLEYSFRTPHYVFHLWGESLIR